MTPAIVVLVVLMACFVLFAVAYARRNSRRPDDIDSFRRQIDALSPESRRETSDRMKPSEGSSTDDDGEHGA